ncbi:MAG: sulfite exporter TauE/SafE family protein [Patescibacteria group bacterium]
MTKEIRSKIENLKSAEDKMTIEAEVEVLDGVDGININESNGNCYIKFDGDRISSEKIISKINELGFSIAMDGIVVDHKPVQPVISEEKEEHLPAKKEEWSSKSFKEHVYKVEGMHCASCEILIEKKLLGIQNIKSVDASTSKGQVVVEYEGDRPNPERLSKLFREENYQFDDLNGKLNKKAREEESKKGANPTLVAFNIAIFVIIAFLLLQKIGIADFLSVGSKSSFMTFIGFGLLAGLSSCAALVGGIILSMSKQWNSLYSEEQTTSQKLQPHIMFNVGRVVSYAVLGGVLGIIGSKLQISPQFTGYLVIGISLLMIALGLQMLGVKAFRKFQIVAPKFATRYIANEKNFQGKQMPFIMGALTFFLPCGFTITAQSLALLSGNAFQGGLIMGAFALGTVPSLLFIGLSSVKFNSKPHLAERFAKVAGFLVLFFALFNMSNQMNVLGFSGLGSIFTSSQTAVVDEKDLPQIIEGKQVIKMTAYGSKDSPNYFKVRVGVPVKWEITADKTAGGCNGSIISNSLFSGSIDLIPGQVSVKEFIPEKTGKFRFSCQMGMISGTIEVVNTTASAGSGVQTANAAGGSTCGGGGGGCGCGGGANIKKDATATTAQVQGDAQIIKATYTANNYLSPNNFKVRSGVPVKLSIDVKDSGQGCGREIMISGLYNNAVALNAGGTINMEFTPSKPGEYDITCGMGMIRFGSIQVI